MSGDLLREAAALLRQRAEAATPGPWAAEQDWIDFGVPDASQTLKGSGEENPIGSICMYYTNKGANGTYIATMHPGVGLAVADWLEATAREFIVLRIESVGGPVDGRRTAGVAVARAILGRQS